MFSFLNPNQNSYRETIPPSQLGYQTNNRFPDFPPLMADGRAVTSGWQPEAVINDRIIRDNNIKSNWQYRRFITEHANEIFKFNFTN
jgi:hypothetical protein